MKIKQEITSTLKMVIVSSVTMLTFYAVQTYAQSYTPPGGNVSGPITTGSGDQTKAGGNVTLANGSLWTSIAVVSNKLVGNTVCIGTDCRTAWPASSSSSGGQFGGIYTTASSVGANCLHANPLAGGCWCPTGYTSYRFDDNYSSESGPSPYGLFYCMK